MKISNKEKIERRSKPFRARAQSATRETSKTKVVINSSSSLELARAHSDASLNSLQDIDTFENAVKLVGKADISLPSNDSLADSESHNDSELIL